MSTEKLDQYLELYSNYIEENVNLHNYNLSFLKYKGGPTLQLCRRAIRNMRKTLYHMSKLLPEVKKEDTANWRADVDRRRVTLPDGTTKVRRVYKKKGKLNGQHNITTTKTV